MSDLSGEVRALRRSQGARAAERKRLEEEEAVDAGKLAAIVKQIERGGTTGDPLTDFILACYGKLDREIERRYRTVEDLISGRAGELVLVSQVHNELDLIRHHEEQQPDDYRAHHSYILGRLEDDQLVLDQLNKSAGLPMKFTRRPMGRVEKGPLWFMTSWYSRHRGERDIGYHFGVPAELKNPQSWYSEAAPIALEIVVGEQKIRDWAEKWDKNHLFYTVRDEGVAKQLDQMIDRLQVLIV